MLKPIAAAALGLMLASGAFAAESKTPFFTVELTDGWQEVAQNSQDGKTVAVYVNQNTGAALTFSFVESDQDVEDVAEQALSQLKASGQFKVGELEEGDNYLQAEVSNAQADSVYYFCSNGDYVSVTTIVAHSQANNAMQSAVDFVKSVEPEDDALIPEL